jgi:hypothetical protein
VTLKCSPKGATPALFNLGRLSFQEDDLMKMGLGEPAELNGANSTEVVGEGEQ